MLKRSLEMKICSLLLVLLGAFSVLQACEAVRLFKFGSQYWYSSDMFGGVIYVGSVEVVGTESDSDNRPVRKYKFRITEILGSGGSEKSEYRVGDVFVSETYRKIANGSAVVCLGAYPMTSETDIDTVIDGAFPLMVDPKVNAALKLVRKHGTDPAKFSRADFDSVKGLMKYPEMHSLEKESTE